MNDTSQNRDDSEDASDGDRGKSRSVDISPTAGIVLFVGMMIYMAVGHLFAPEMPNKPAAPRYVEGFDLSFLDEASEEVRYKLARDRFWDRWTWNGWYLLAACVALYCGWRNFVRPRQVPATRFDRFWERFGNTHVPSWLGFLILLAILAAALIPLGIAVFQER